MLTDPAYAPWREEATRRGYASSIALPLVAGDQTFGALNIYAGEPDAFAPDEAELLGKLADNLAFGIQALRGRTALRESEAKYRILVEQASRRLKLVQALRNIDLAITGSFDLRVTFSVALDEITTQLGLDAAAILILNLPTQTLEYAAWRGFCTRALPRLRLRLGEGYTPAAPPSSAAPSTFLSCPRQSATHFRPRFWQTKASSLTTRYPSSPRGRSRAY